MGGRRALITGVTGQDGSYLAELLLSKGYEVHGLVRPDAHDEPDPVAGVDVHVGTLQDPDVVSTVVADVQPEECYHLAAHTFIGVRPVDEFGTFQVNAVGTHHVLSALHEHAPECRFFFAGTSEMFGEVEQCPQSEETPFRPRSIYGVSKLSAYDLMRYYRQARDMFACCGILYNHESPRRGKQFLTRKVTSSAAAIQAGLAWELRLGNLDTIRDWGHARDYVRAMWLMLQQAEPDDYVVATGQGRTVREFVEQAFSAVGLRWEEYVVVDPAFYRPAEIVPLVGCSEKAQKRLGWAPECGFEELVREMVSSDQGLGCCSL